MSPLQSTCLSHWFKDRLDSTMRDLGCCAQNIKGTSMKGFRMLTKFWPCHYGSWKLRRPGAHGKATKVIWKKTGPCNLGDSMAHWEWSGLVYQRTWLDVCYICHIFYAPASQPVGIETWVHGISWVPWQTGHANDHALKFGKRAFHWLQALEGLV